MDQEQMVFSPFSKGGRRTFTSKGFVISEVCLLRCNDFIESRITQLVP